MENKLPTFDSLPHQVSQVNQKLDKLLDLFKNQSAGEADQNQLLTIDQAAKFLNLAKQTLYAKISRNEIPVHKPAGSKRVYFYKQDLLDYISKGRQKTIAEYQENATNCLTKKRK